MEHWRRSWLGMGLCLAATAQAADAVQDVTIITEFSDTNASAYQQQMTHWQLLLQDRHDLRVCYVHVSLQRGFELLDQSGYCTVNKLKTTERQQRWLFSAKPITVSPSIRLITLKSASAGDADNLPQQTINAIDLPTWLRQAGRPKIGIVAGRSYGAEIDPLIKARPTQFYSIYGQDVSLKLWQMLKRGRVEAIFEYPPRIDYLQSIGQEQTGYTALPIQGQPLHLEGYVLCNRHEHGQRLMRYLDQLMAQPKMQQALTQSYRQYFTAAEWRSLTPYLQQTFPAAAQHGEH